MRASSASFKDFVQNAVLGFPAWFAEARADVARRHPIATAAKPSDIIATFHKRQRLLHSKLVQLACDVWGVPNKEDSIHFFGQSVLLDIQTSVLVDEIEMIRLLISRVESDRPDRPKVDRVRVCCHHGADPNLNAWDPDLVHPGPGARAALAYLRSSTNRPKLTIREAFTETLALLRELPAPLLYSMGIRMVKATDGCPFCVLVDAVSGMVWDVRHFEHWLCKYFLVLKHQCPQNMASRNPRCDKPHCQPLVLGSSVRGLSVYEWDDDFDNAFALLCESVVFAFSHYVNDADMKTPSAMAIFHCTTLPGGVVQLKHRDPAACFDDEPDVVGYSDRRPGAITIKQNASGQWEQVGDDADVTDWSQVGDDANEELGEIAASVVEDDADEELDNQSAVSSEAEIAASVVEGSEEELSEEELAASVVESEGSETDTENRTRPRKKARTTTS